MKKTITGVFTLFVSMFVLIQVSFAASDPKSDQPRQAAMLTNTNVPGDQKHLDDKKKVQLDRIDHILASLDTNNESTDKLEKEKTEMGGDKKVVQSLSRMSVQKESSSPDVTELTALKERLNSVKSFSEFRLEMRALLDLLTGNNK